MNWNNTFVYDSIVCRCFYIGLFDFILIGKSLTDIKNLFYLNKLRDKDGIILSHFLKNYQISETLPIKLKNIALQLMHNVIGEIKNYLVKKNNEQMI